MNKSDLRRHRVRGEKTSAVKDRLNLGAQKKRIEWLGNHSGGT